jgi:hypothetical protein
MQAFAPRAEPRNAYDIANQFDSMALLCAAAAVFPVAFERIFHCLTRCGQLADARMIDRSGENFHDRIKRFG